MSLSAMMYWAIIIHSNGSTLPTVGLLLTLVGAAGFVTSAFVFSKSRRSENTHHTLDRQVSDLHNGFRSIRQGMMQLTLRVLSSATTRPPPQLARARGTSACRKVSNP
jgi:hypothetical protein